jgi:peptidoglycan/LPS O-acetylase OafA/YrhL
MNQEAKIKNGNIELMRFIFSVIIILYHISNRIEITLPEPFSFFSRGKIGVEFFFLVSGFLMAKSAQKYDSKRLAESTKSFMVKKLKVILPYHLITFFSCFILMLCLSDWKSKTELAERTVETLPNLFFLQMSGVKEKALLTPEWYIAAMLWMMLIIFPLILKFREGFTKIVCPVVSVILIGYIIRTSGMLGAVGKPLFGGLFSKGYIRAFAEMCGGAFCYNVSRLLSKAKLTKPKRLFLTLIELICYLIPILYTVSRLSCSYEAYAFYSLAVAITLSFSSSTYFSNHFNNKLVYIFGKISLPLYMSQSIAFRLMNYVGKTTAVGTNGKIVFCIITTAVCAVIMELLIQAILKRIKK